jgi:hypothetical protein
MNLSIPNRTKITTDHATITVNTGWPNPYLTIENDAGHYVGTDFTDAERIQLIEALGGTA